ncbi:MAG: hypothetical protein EXS47_00840 [Candidatus Zambryskibacteria bacterium]|nr:hypothetical protein [Candidatus Zambryskibacteria bacterium]
MQKNKGFTLLIAIVVTSMLLIVSFVVINIALKQLVLASANKESQYAFYAADGGTECAIYWDLIGIVSKFDPATSDLSITCSGQTISTNSQTSEINLETGSGAVPTIPSTNSRIGGGGVNATSTFWLKFKKGCAIVQVGKVSGFTTIDSRGYNTCDTSASRRFERGVVLSY